MTQLALGLPAPRRRKTDAGEPGWRGGYWWVRCWTCGEMHVTTPGETNPRGISEWCAREALCGEDDDGDEG